jgi:hypothetical protein
MRAGSPTPATAAAWLLLLAGCASAAPPVVVAPVIEPEPAPEPLVEPAPPSVAAPEPEPLVTDSGLGIEDVRIGNGAEAVAGSTVLVHYAGRLSDGSPFDSSYQRGDPFEFTLGAGNVIAG